MYKLLISIIIIIGFIQKIHSQEMNKDSISVKAFWQKGEKKSYEIIKKKKTIKDGKITKQDIKKVFITFEVLDSTATNYLLKYTKDSIQIPGVKIKKYDNSVQNILGKIKYEFATDSYGEFQELYNWKEVRDSTLSLLKLNYFTLDKSDSENNEKIMQLIEEFVKDKDKLENSLLNEIGPIFNDYGYFYPVDDTIAYQEQLTNVLGSGIIPANGKFVVHYNDENKEVEYNTLINVDPETSKKLIIETILSLSNKTNKSTEIQELENAKLDIQIRSKIKYDLIKGWVIESYQLKEIIMNDTQQESVTIEENIVKPLKN